MIESLIKGAEYRGITAYWIVRLFRDENGRKITKLTANFLASNIEILKWWIESGKLVFRNFDAVKFSYGYTKRTMTFEIESITIGKGKPEWGAPTEDVFIIKLGNRYDNKTRYNVGDEVWFNFKGKPKKMKVSDIFINLSDVQELELKAKGIIVYTSPLSVFPTKEELLKSL